MDLRNEFAKMIQKRAEPEYSQLSEGTVVSVSLNGVYKVRLRNGFIASGVSGPTGLEVNAPVLTSTYPGKRGKYVIIGRGGKKVKSMVEIRVP